MAIKIDIGLFMFALMLSTLFCVMTFLLPVSITSLFPSFANPISILSFSSPASNFGALASLITPFSCTIGALYLDCIGTPLLMLLEYLGLALHIIFYVITYVIGIVIFFITSGYFTISIFPTWISIPISILLLAIHSLVILDISIMVKGLFEI